MAKKACKKKPEPAYEMIPEVLPTFLRLGGEIYDCEYRALFPSRPLSKSDIIMEFNACTLFLKSSNLKCLNHVKQVEQSQTTDLLFVLVLYLAPVINFFLILDLYHLNVG